MCNDPAARYTPGVTNTGGLDDHQPTSGTNVHEIAAGIYRINTPVAIPGGVGFNFNQYLVVDDDAAALPHRPAAHVPARRRGDRPA